MSPMLIGTLGVGLLLVAFLLNLMRRLSESHPVYLSMNLAGAALACWYALDSRLWPFVVLEATWGLVALWRLIIAMKNPRPSAGG